MRILARFQWIQLRASLRESPAANVRKAVTAVLVFAGIVVMGFLVLTSHGASTDLGKMPLSREAALELACLFTIAGVAFAWSMPRPDALQPADAVWWRLAGFEREERERFCVAYLGLRGFAGIVAVVAGGCGALSLAAPERWPEFASIGAATLAVATATILATVSVPGRAVRRVSRERSAGERVAEAAPPIRAVPMRHPAMWLVTHADSGRALDAAGVLLVTLFGIGLGALATTGAFQRVGPGVFLGLAVGFALLARPGRYRVDPGDPWWRLGLGRSWRAIVEFAYANSYADGLRLALFIAALGAVDDNPFVVLGAMLAPLWLIFVRSADLLLADRFPGVPSIVGFTLRLPMHLAVAAIAGEAASWGSALGARAGNAMTPHLCGLAAASIVLLAAAALPTTMLARRLACGRRSSARRHGRV